MFGGVLEVAGCLCFTAIFFDTFQTVDYFDWSYFFMKSMTIQAFSLIAS